MDTSTKLKIDDEFKCGEYMVKILKIDIEHDVIGYSIAKGDEHPVRSDSRYRDRFIQGLAEYGY